MSKMNDISVSIQEMLASGYDFQEISNILNVPIEWVEIECKLMEESENDYDDSMDGDHESALASVGWGTDEDYGYYGEEF